MPCASAIAIHTRWRWPPDSSSTTRSASSSVSVRVERLGDRPLVLATSTGRRRRGAGGGRGRRGRRRSRPRARSGSAGAGRACGRPAWSAAGGSPAPSSSTAPARGSQQPRQAAEQGGLAARVGADDDGDLAVRDPQVEVAYDVGVGVAERQGARLQPGRCRGRGGDGHAGPPGGAAAGEQPEQERCAEGAGDDADGQVEVGEGVGPGVVGDQHDDARRRARRRPASYVRG